MTATLKRMAQPRRSGRAAPDAAEAMIRFSITPTDAGAWLWRTFDRDGRARNEGLATRRNQAAALIIRDILRGCEPVARARPGSCAKAA